MIAVIIKTAPGRRSLQHVLAALELQLPSNGYRLYLYDEAPLDPWKGPAYNNLRSAGHEIMVSPGPISVNVARNVMLKKLEDESFVLRMDDDFELGGEFSFTPLQAVLADPSIDFCSCIERQIGPGRITPSGSTRIQAGFIRFAHAHYRPEIELQPDEKWRYATRDGVRYAIAEYMRNFILMKRHCIETVRWNERLNFEGEHYDFYFSLKKAGFVGAFTPDAIYLHRDDLKHLCVDMTEEKKWRGDMQSAERQLMRKVLTDDWGGIPPVTLRRPWPIRAARRAKRALKL